MRWWWISMILTLCAANSPHHRVQRARPVLQRDPEPRHPPAAHLIAQQNIRQQPRVDIAAAQHQPDALAREFLGVRQHRRQPSRARALHHGLLDLQQQRHRMLERALVDQQDLVDQLRNDLGGELAGRLDRDSLCQRVTAARHVHAVDVGRTSTETAAPALRSTRSPD